MQASNSGAMGCSLEQCKLTILGLWVVFRTRAMQASNSWAMGCV